MGEILYLVHRIPYPPDKGDKIRSWNILRHLLRNHRVHLGCLIDDARDLAFVEALKGKCASAHFARLHPKTARLRGLARGLLFNEPLSVGYFFDSGLARWVEATLAARPISHIVLYSSPMAHYVLGRRGDAPPIVIDFVDVDSDKWRQYAASKRGPERWIYRREAKTLLAFERRVARETFASLLSTPAEADLFRTLAPDSAAKTFAMSNGVDLDYFSPDRALPSPYQAGERAIVFTGAMDYWANVDAVSWFAKEIWPGLRARCGDARFFIVGGKPTERVKDLAKIAGVTVTGRVEDVRPYVLHAAVAIAPMRIARGVQNKVLEGMAMGRAVVATPQGLEGIDAIPGTDLLIAPDADGFGNSVAAILDDPALARDLGESARTRMMERYSWEANLAVLDEVLARPAR